MAPKRDSKVEVADRGKEGGVLDTLGQYWDNAKRGNMEGMWKTAKEHPKDTAVLAGAGLLTLYATKSLIEWWRSDNTEEAKSEKKESWFGSILKYLGIGALGIFGLKYLKEFLPDPANLMETVKKEGEKLKDQALQAGQEAVFGKPVFFL